MRTVSLEEQMRLRIFDLGVRERWPPGLKGVLEHLVRASQFSVDKEGICKTFIHFGGHGDWAEDAYRFLVHASVLILHLRPIPGIAFDALRAQEVLDWVRDASVTAISLRSREDGLATRERLLDAWHMALEEFQRTNPIVVTFPEDLQSLPEAEFAHLREMVLPESCSRARELLEDALAMLNRAKHPESNREDLTAALEVARHRVQDLGATAQRFDREATRRKAKGKRERLEAQRGKILADLAKVDAELAALPSNA